MTFPADDDLLDPGSYSDSLVLGCVLLSFAGSLSSTCLCVCLGHALPWKYGLHITNTWIWNQSGICTVPISLTQIPVQKLIIQNTNPLRCNNCLCKVLSNIDSSNTFFHVKYHFCIKPIWTNLLPVYSSTLKIGMSIQIFLKSYRSAAKTYHYTIKYLMLLTSSLTVVYPEEECPVTSIISPVGLVPPPWSCLLYSHPVGDSDLDLRQMASGHGAILVHLRPTASNWGRLQVLL